MRRCGKACTCRSTFRVQSREVHRREKVKPLHVPTKDKRLQAMRSGATQPALEERHVLSSAIAFQQTAKDKGKEGTLVQSVRLWASWGHNHWAKSRGPWQLSTLARRGLATSLKILRNHWKEKGGGGGKGRLFDLLSAVLGSPH